MNLREKLNDLLHHYHKTEVDIETIYYFPINTNQVLQLNIAKTLELLENLEPDGTDLIKLQFKGNDFIIESIDVNDDDSDYGHIAAFEFHSLPHNTDNVIYTPDSLTNTVYDEDFRLHVPFKTDTTIADNQRESHFVAFLDTHYNGKLEEALYVDYNDEFSANRMAEFVKDAVEYKTPIEALVNDYILENTEWCPEFETIRAFIEATNQKEEDFFDCGPTDLCDYYRELFTEYVYIDYGAKDLLKNSTPEDLTIFFGGYWDNDYGDIEEHYNQDNKTVSTPIEWLLETQGYTEDDLHDESKRQNSTFLTSLYDELYDMSDLSDYQLVAIPDSNDWNAIVALCRKEGAIIRKSTTFGLFDSNNGGGSLMGITLEKDIFVNDQTPIHRVAIQEGRQWLDYTPKAVYCLSRNHFHGNDLDVQDYQPLLNDVLETLESRDIDTSKLNIIEEKE